MTYRVLTLSLSLEQDVVLARQRTRHIAQLLGFGPQDQTRLATAVSEIARNAYAYAGGGKVHYALEGERSPQVLIVTVADKGPGIARLAEVLNGTYQSSTGMGIGIRGAMRLMDQSDIQSTPAGTSITLKKILPTSVPTIGPVQIGELTKQLAHSPLASSFDEVQRHNQELLRALEEVRERQEQLLQLTAELEDTNRGVVALYAELDEKADHLRRADEMKSRFLSNMSHEFRTPLSSIRALSKLLLNRVDGDLGGEQEKQVSLILRGAEDLSELVNDLLDLAKIEAGKTEVRPAPVAIDKLFSALRGMLRPLLVTHQVELIFGDTDDVPVMNSDEGKISQILRNFISNALKFTERGEVEVTAALTVEGRAVEFRVRDTGLGIAPENLALIFEEFTQVEHRLQTAIKGTGLGLPLCRKLAELLGGEIRVESVLGKGSVFIATIPLHFQPSQHVEQDLYVGAVERFDPMRPIVLIVEDEPATQLLYEKYLKGTHYQHLSVGSISEARRVLRMLAPAVIVLDIGLPGEDGWRFLAEVKNGVTAKVPVIVATEAEDVRKGMALGADAYFIKPLERHDLLASLARFDTPPGSSGTTSVPDTRLGHTAQGTSA